MRQQIPVADQVNVAENAIGAIGLAGRFQQRQHAIQFHGAADINRVLAAAGFFQIVEHARNGNVGALVDHQADRALLFVVMHQQDDGLGKVRIAQIAAGH